MSLRELSIDQLQALYKNRERSVTEVLTETFAHIEKADPELHAFITVCKERAMDEARRLDARLAAGESVGRLAGIPVAIKDNMNLSGVPTTCASRILEGYVPPYTGTAVARLQAEDAIIVGKANLDEFAMGSTTENSAFFTTRNPHNPDRVAGGSSGGSSVAVAAGMATLALGSDTGGSIRTPASFCGVVGVKPTYGRVSRYGLVAFASSLDQIGPFGNNVRDCARALEIICGFDPYDSTSADAPVEPLVESLDRPIAGIRVGIPREYFIPGMDAEVKARIEACIKVYEGLGCKLEDISLPHTEQAVATYYLVATAEASSNLARYDGVRYGVRKGGDAGLTDMYRKTRMNGFGKEVKRRILLGTYALSAGYYDAYYLKALKVRTLIQQDFRNAFEKVDVILTPTSPTVAFKIGEKSGDPLSMYLSDIFTITCNLAGLPGVSVPCGKNSEGMPIGMQLLANHFQEALLLRAAHHFERAFLLQ